MERRHCSVCDVALYFRRLGKKKCYLCNTDLCNECVEFLPPSKMKVCPLCSLCHSHTSEARRLNLQEKSVRSLKWMANHLGVNIDGCLEKRDMVEAIIVYFAPPTVITKVEHVPYPEVPKEYSKEVPIQTKKEKMVYEDTPGMGSYPDTPGNEENTSALETMIAELSISQLKKYLSNTFINTSTFVEKSELQAALLAYCRKQPRDRLKELFPKYEAEIEHAEGLYDSPILEDDFYLCKICMENRSNCLFLECGHVGVCLVCSQMLQDCPFCRRKITRHVPIYYV